MVSRARPALTRERVLEAAIHLADESGIESLSMRKLARELGVEAMSLYNHVASKGDLLDAMVDTVMSEIELPDAGEWDQAIRACAVSAHDAFIRHRWAAGLLLSPSSIPRLDSARLAYMEWLLRRLRTAGFSPELTYHGYHALDSHILGFTLWELGHSASARAVLGDQTLADFLDRFLVELRASGKFPYLIEHAEQHIAAPSNETGGEFEFGLDLILDGLRKARATD